MNKLRYEDLQEGQKVFVKYNRKNFSPLPGSKECSNGIETVEKGWDKKLRLTSTNGCTLIRLKEYMLSGDVELFEVDDTYIEAFISKYNEELEDFPLRTINTVENVEQAIKKVFSPDYLESNIDQQECRGDRPSSQEAPKYIQHNKQS